MRLDTTTVALVTGAASGLGAALARRLDARGVALALCDVDKEGLQSVSDSLTRPAHFDVVDVADEAAIRRFTADATAKLGRIDLVIANAGVAYTADVEHATTAAYDRVIGIDLFGVIHTVRAVLPQMIAAHRGYVVTISSLFGLIGVPSQSAYCAAKAGVKGFTESLDMEMRDRGVGVLCVHPGAIATNITQDPGFTTDSAARAAAAAMIARGLRPDDAAERIVRAVERDRRRLLLGNDARLVAAMQRLLPVRYRDVLVAWSRRLSARSR